MIDLHDPLWRTLTHAHGDGFDVPSQLKRIETSATLGKKFWDNFTNTLCHQCTIGSASLAAFPHLVRIAKNNSHNKKGLDCIQLASLILMYALGPENKIPKLQKELDAPFRDAINDGRNVVIEMYDQKRRTVEENMLYLSMVAIFDLRADIGNVLGELCLGWCDCPKCEERVSFDDLSHW